MPAGRHAACTLSAAAACFPLNNATTLASVGREGSREYSDVPGRTLDNNAAMSLQRGLCTCLMLDNEHASPTILRLLIVHMVTHAQDGQAWPWGKGSSWGICIDAGGPCLRMFQRMLLALTSHSSAQLHFR